MYCSLKFILIVIFFCCLHSSSMEEIDPSKYVLAVGLFIHQSLLTFPKFQGVRLNKLLIPEKLDFQRGFRRKNGSCQWENRKLFS